MVTIRFDGRAWVSPQVEPLAPLPLHPGTAALHYAQDVFEGLKAHRRADGTVVLFRAHEHAERFNHSLLRMAMPELRVDLFVESLHQLVGVDHAWVPTTEGASLYLRPFMFATDTSLGAGRPSSTYLFVVLASPSGAYFGARTEPISVWLSEHYIRAAAGGTGEAKAGANYAGALLGLQEAAAHGCDQAVWLDAAERRFVEEAGAMNLFFVLGRGSAARLVTPGLTGTFLPGITRQSHPRACATARVAGVRRTHQRRDARPSLCASGELTEAFACGTAAIMVGIGSIRSATSDWKVGESVEGPVTKWLRDLLRGIQRGTEPDAFSWSTTVKLV